MKYNCLLILTLSLLITCPAMAIVYVDDPCGVPFRFEFDIQWASRTDQIILDVAVPNTIPYRQRIYDLNFSVKPARVQEVENRKYVRFFLKNRAKNEKIVINGRAILEKYDLITAMRQKKEPKMAKIAKNDLLKYTESEKFIDITHPKLQKKAQDLQKNNRMLTVLAIHTFVTQHLRYSFSEANKGAVWALENRRGDCDEYTALFVALCRANEIPAKWVTGYTVRWENVPEHSWAEVYFEEYGWVPFDPTHNAQGWKNPSALEKKYLYVSDIISDAMLGGGPNYFYYQYWGSPPGIEMRFNAGQ